jgi:hypothetical protein
MFTKRTKHVTTKQKRENLASYISKRSETAFASSKYTAEYRFRVSTSLGRYNDYRKANFYAIIVPSGLGKTTLAQKYDLMDVDEIIVEPEVIDKLITIRRAKLASEAPNWTTHNKEWYGEMREALKDMVFDRPEIILVHTEEAALEIGAIPILAITCETDIGLTRRDTVSNRLGMINRQVVKNRTVTVPIHTVTTHTEAERLVAGAAMQVKEIGAPIRWAKLEYHGPWPRGYGRDVPEWILKGEVRDDCVETVQGLFNDGLVPAACLKYYSDKIYRVFGQDHGMPQASEVWAQTMYKIKRNAGPLRALPDDLFSGGDWIKAYPYGSMMEQNRAGIGLRALNSACPLQQDDYCLKILRHHLGEKHGLVCAILIYYLGVVRTLGPELQDMVRDSGILLVKASKFISIAKEVHGLVRSTGEWFGRKLPIAERTKCMYIHMLYGRELYEVDATAEIIKRSHRAADKVSFDGTGWTHKQYRDDLISGVRDAYKWLGSKPLPKYQSLADFWLARREWGAKGSTVLNKILDKKYRVTLMMDHFVEKVIEKRHNKKSLFEDPKTYEDILSGVISEYASNTTKVVPKWESAAQRALLPGNLYHYVVFSVILTTFEKGGPVGNVGLNAIPDLDFRNFDIRLGKNLERFCFDFTDFNAQHEVEDMALVIEELRRHHPEPSQFLNFCISWIRDAMDNLEILDKGQKHKLERGLFSGWRGTTWINSVLNHAYFYVARSCYLRLFAKDPVIYYEGKGDDVEIHTDNRQSSARLYNICLTIGYEANVLKQLFGDVSEFLRILYTSEGHFGSVARVLGNYVSGNWEGEGGNIAERLAARLENIETMKLRGLSRDMGDCLYKACLLHWGRVKSDDTWLTPSDCILHGRVEDNGLGVPDVEGRIYVLKEAAPLPAHGKWFVELPAVSASNDWIYTMREELSQFGLDSPQVVKAVQEVARDSYDIKRVTEDWALKLDPKDWQRYWSFKTDVTGYIQAPRVKSEPGLGRSFLVWANEKHHPALDAYRRIKRFESFDRYLAPNWKKIVGGDYFYEEAEKLKTTLPRGCNVSAYILSGAADMCREAILTGKCRLREAQYMFWVICQTMSEI